MTALRVLAVGSVPPEWGGKTAGGVATVHRLLLLEFVRRPDVALKAVLPLNHDGVSPGPSEVRFALPPADRRLESEFYKDLIRGVDAVLFSHVGHRWALLHARHHGDVPALGSIHSWHQITQTGADQAARARKVLDEVLAGLPALSFPSRHTVDEGPTLGFRYSCPVYVIPNPIDSQYLHYPPSERNGIVFVGSLIPRKRADLALEASARLGRVCTVIGDGPEAGRLRCHAIRTGAEARFLGQIPPEGVAVELAGAEALCVPSESESFGNVYLESIACGTPVVGFAPTISEIFDQLNLSAGAGVYPPDADSVTRALTRVLGQEWDRPALREAVRDRFSAETVASAYLDILRGVGRDRRI